MTGSFVGEEIAVGYARHRPPVHAHIFEIVEARAGALQVQRALDLGCGASLSPECSGGGLQVIGFDPSPAMFALEKAYFSSPLRCGCGRSRASRERNCGTGHVGRLAELCRTG